MVDVLVQGSVDVQQRAGDIQDGFRLGGALAIDHLDDHPPLLVDHLRGRRQSQHAQRVADPVQDVDLRGKLLRIAVLATQEYVQAFLDAQQILANRLGNGIKQGAIASRHRRACPFELLLGRDHLAEVEAARNGLAAARAGRRLRKVIQQRARQVARVIVCADLLALVLRMANGAIEMAELLTQAGKVMIESPLLQGFQHAARDPPQTSRRLGMTDRAQLVHAVAHFGEIRLLALGPRQQLHLEAGADLADALTQVGERIGRARACGIGR